MCGRFTVSRPGEIAAYFGVQLPAGWQGPRFNVAPTQDVLVMTNREPRQLELIRWGLVPSFAKDPSVGVKMINARSETLFERPAFREAIRRRRCVVLADGFYEWEKRGKERIPHYIQRDGGAPIALAGLWASWSSASGTALETCALVTGPAHDLLSPVHHRMPLVIDETALGAWLSPATLGAAAVAELLVPHAATGWTMREVSKRVNSAALDDPSCLTPGPSQARLFD